MFKKNNKHKQTEIFDWDFALPHQKRLEESIWAAIRREVFEKVDEEAFSVLYRSHTGRPNSPINEIITLMIIKEMYDWTIRELGEHMYWHIGVLYAVGQSVGESTVTTRTISNFIQALANYEKDTGVDLFNNEFERLVGQLLKTYPVSTKIARVDSSYFTPNVVAYNRLQIVIESIKRLYRVVSEADQSYLSELCPRYIKQDADNYVAGLTSQQVKAEFPKLGECILAIIEQFGVKYERTKEWQMFIRIFREQFDLGTDSGDKPTIDMKPSEDKSSDDIRAIDDSEATLRYKSGVNHLGYAGNVIETADPESALNLIVDVDMYPNNTSDGQMLYDALDDLVKERLSDLQEIHFDGGYGGPILDAKLMEYNINCVQTGIRGVKCGASMHLEYDQGAYYLTCAANQRIVCDRRNKGYRATFDRHICESCSKFDDCPVQRLKKSGDIVYYLKDKDIPKRLRLSYINTIPESRRTIRSGIEATIRQFKCMTKASKTRLRGRFRHKLWLLLRALAINVTRIFNYTTGLSTNAG